MKLIWYAFGQLIFCLIFNLLFIQQSFAQSNYVTFFGKDDKLDSIQYDSVVKIGRRTFVYYYHQKKKVEGQADSITEVAKFTEQRPSFPGGDEKLFQFLSQNIVYPKVAREKGIEGTVILYFVVNKDGSISGFEFKQSVGAGCSEEAIRVISIMPKWIPGSQQGKFVRVAYTIPIKFKLD